MMTDKKFYVYIHRRATDGSVFYVGKGSGVRANLVSGRSTIWTRTYKKHGRVVEIVQNEMNNEDAVLLEMLLIAKLRHEGESLVNLTDGGEGFGVGCIRTLSDRVVRRDTQGGRDVYCSNGMKFYSQREAVRWLHTAGVMKASPGPISRCIHGKSKSAYGYAWSYNDFPAVPERTGIDAIAHSIKSRSSKPVRCLDTGKIFESAAKVEIWLRSNGFPKALNGNISSACRGKYSHAYGYKWEFVDG